ncbi:hypothetical protein NQZ68_023766 [Dissostichus eleginoides]|nr:hypothetical protein NQZ68_023766 [Dissostichus eleginoides]
MTRRVGKCGRTLRPQPRPQGFYQSVHAATTGLQLNLTHSEASSPHTSAASRHGLDRPASPGTDYSCDSAQQQGPLSHRPQGDSLLGHGHDG